MGAIRSGRHLDNTLHGGQSVAKYSTPLEREERQKELFYVLAFNTLGLLSPSFQQQRMGGEKSATVLAKPSFFSYLLAAWEFCVLRKMQTTNTWLSLHFFMLGTAGTLRKELGMLEWTGLDPSRLIFAQGGLASRSRCFDKAKLR